MNLLGIDTSSMDAKLHIQNFETVLLGVTVGKLVLADGKNTDDLADLIIGWRDDGVCLVAGAAAFSDRAETMRVGTQGDNAPSLALYRGAGLAEARRQETLHWVNVDTAPAEGAPAS